MVEMKKTYSSSSRKKWSLRTDDDDERGWSMECSRVSQAIKGPGK